MKDKDYEYAKLRYENLLFESMKIERLLEEKEKLLYNPDVKRYLELEQLSAKDLLDESQMITKAFGSISEDINIYVLEGMYYFSAVDFYEEGDGDIKVNNILQADYLKYYSLDTGELIKVNKEDVSKFELSNLIFRFHTDNVHDIFKKLRMYYLDKVLETKNDKDRIKEDVKQYYLSLTKRNL